MNLLRVTDGTTTVSFTTEPHAVLEYVPQVLPVATSRDSAPSGSPADVLSEGLAVALVGTTLAAALAERDGLERLLFQAARVAGGSGEARVWVECRRDASPAGTPLYRSELVAGAVQEMDIDGYWPERAVVRLRLHWVRRAWWEGPEAEIALLDANGVPVTGGVIVHPAWGGPGAGNHADLAAIEGDMPAPLRVQFINLRSGVVVKRIYVGLRCARTLGGFVHMIEGEDSLLGTMAAATGCSNVAYAVMSWVGTADAQIGDWWLSSMELGKAGGRWYRLIARFLAASLPPVAPLVQARLTRGGVASWVGPWVRAAGGELCELGSVALPAVVVPPDGDFGGAAPADCRLELWARSSVAGPHLLSLDYIAALGLDGFRRYDCVGAGIDGDEYLIDDPQGAYGSGMAGQVYTGLAGGGIVADWQAAGGALTVQPGYSHRIAVLWQDNAGVADAGWAGMLRLWYRPRVSIP